MENLLIDYIDKEYTKSHEAELSLLRNLTDYIYGIPNEVEAPNGAPYRIHNHQWHLRFPSNSNIVNESAKVYKEIDSQEFANFDELYDYVNHRKVSHFGPTCVYDFALRYGWNHNPRIVPQQYIYIHSKPRRAAVRLVELGYIPDISKSPRQSLDIFSEFLFLGLSAMDVEHFLCVYHDLIKELPQNNIHLINN